MSRLTRRDLIDYHAGGWFDSRIMPLADYNTVYVRNPKVGTSTLLLWLHRIHTGDDTWAPDRGVHGEHGLPTPLDVGWPRVETMLSGDAYRFSFVREPVGRLESAFRSKIEADDGGRWRKRIRTTLGLPEDGRKISFDQFLDAIEQEEPIRMDAHWRPQHLTLMHPLIEYDKVGRLESFAADIEEIRAATGLPALPLENRNVSTRPPDSVYDGRPDLRRRVEALYATDFELYGY